MHIKKQKMGGYFLKVPNFNPLIVDEREKMGGV
ncbi:MAG: hypothetical protein CM15mP22_6130 [Gammaproteobacteria bacterium]|nr:MAG: hypothetical protein CM15mP22_6130 [Gammaproteobacteria bacterium]